MDIKTNTSVAQSILAQIRQRLSASRCAAAAVSDEELRILEQAFGLGDGACRYCANIQNWWMFRADVRIPNMETGLTEDVNVPVYRCPHCGRLLRAYPNYAPCPEWSVPAEVQQDTANAEDAVVPPQTQVPALNTGGEETGGGEDEEQSDFFEGM